MTKVSARLAGTVESASFDLAVPVLVLNVGAYPYNQSSVGIARSLGRLGIPVYVVQHEALLPAGVSRHLAGTFLWRPTQDAASFVAGMRAIAGTIGRRAIVVPTCDIAALLLAEHAAALAPWFLLPAQRAELPRTLADKRGLARICEELGVPHPRALVVGTRAELRDALTRVTFPAVVKGAEGWLLPPGIASTTIVTEPAQAVALFDVLERAGTPTALLVQEMIPAAAAQDWIVHGYCGGTGEPLRVFTGIKLRSYPAFAGATTLARCADNPALRAQAEALFRKLDYRGILDLDFRFDPRDDTYKLLDFNPRVGAQFRLFEDERGVDVVRALHLDLTGRVLPPARQIEGRSFLSEIPDALAAVRYVRGGVLSVREWWRSVRAVDEGAWFALDDPAPIALMGVRVALERCPAIFRPRRDDDRGARPRLL
jgi:predicted ATP-grasp superfamily ATP-dependent carboligase